MERRQAGQLPERRDPLVQPGRLQHGGLPRHAHRQGRVPPQPPGLPARPGLHDPDPRGRRPADQRPGRRVEHPAPQAARRGPPRGRAPAAPQLQVVRVPPRLDEGRGQGRPRRPGRRPAGDPPRRPGPERPGEDAAGRRRRPLRRRLVARRDPDLLLQLVQPRDRRRRRRRLRRLQEPGRGRRHRPLPRPRRQRPADAPGRGPRVQGRRGPARTTRSTGRSSPS